MTRKETIQQLRLRIEAKQQEIDELTARLGAEIVADFNETYHLTPGQHFMYAGRECVGVESDGRVLRWKQSGQPPCSADGRWRGTNNGHSAGSSPACPAKKILHSSFFILH